LKRIPAERSVLGAFGATALTLYLLVAWTRRLEAGWLILSLVAFVAALGLTIIAWRRRARVPTSLLVALGMLLLGSGSATLLTWQFEHLEQNWDEVVADRQARLGSELDARMTDIVQRGRSAADQAAAMAAARTDTHGMFRFLGMQREQYDVDALALYTEQGGLLAWAGEHRGALPDTIWMRDATAYFEERPLFSYLYFPVRVSGRGEYAIAAVLIETGVITDDSGNLGDVVAARTQTRASFRRGAADDAVWTLVAGRDTVVHARLEPLTQSAWRQMLELTARRTVLLTVLGAFIALCMAWLRCTGASRPAWASTLPLVALLPVVIVAPLREALDAERMFSPLLFALPLRDMSLGRLLVVLLPLAALLAGARRRPRGTRQIPLRIAVGVAAVAAAYPLVLYLLLNASTPALRQGGGVYWYGFQLAAVLLLSMITLLALPRAARERVGRSWLHDAPRAGLIATALLLSLAMGVFASLRNSPVEAVRLYTAAFWALPFGLAAVALAPLMGRAGALSRLMLSGWLAATAVLPHLWTAHVDARLAAAEEDLSKLGSRADPFLHYLLEEFALQAEARYAGGESGVQLLYRSWVASGLAQQPYPARLALWVSADPEFVPTVQLGSAPMPRMVELGDLDDLLQAAGAETRPRIMEFTDLPDLSRLLTVPLQPGLMITVMVPPRRTLDRTSAIAPFLGVIAPASTRLNLVEASGPAPPEDVVTWEPGEGGWRSEAFVKYPDGWYHAHLAVQLPPGGVRLARGMLLLALDLAVLGLLWALGVVARGGAAVARGDWRRWLDSFRARITLALFAFFLVPTAVFGWAAYTALAGEVAGVARTVAQHAVAQAVREMEEGRADLRELAAHAGTDVLRYIQGELIDVSSREALDLGVYGAWMPPGVYNRLQAGEDLAAVETQTLGNQSYVTAFRTVRPSGTLGVPMSLSSGQTAERQRQVAHLVLFAAVIGALLSLALSLAVGRALAGPIGQLRRASAAVGAGRLRVRLPERVGGEFGQLFTSFNRMTRRLRRARARQLRTARVLAWGEMARQVAHEIKNPLTPIKLSVQHMRRAHMDRHPQFDEILESNVSQILVEIDRLSEIARAFSRYGAPSLASGPLTHVDAPAVIRESLTLYRSGDRAIRYIDDVPADLPRVLARADELKEVILNLVENARAALNGAGDIIISGYAVGDDRVEIEVADNGPGIPAEFLSRIFEPHFSTRSSGTGLGLAIVRRIVESWGGTVTAESGAGTIIRVRLQAAGARANDDVPSDTSS
jgi:signal transduction histidine kinase